MKKKVNEKSSEVSRRDFIKTSAAVGVSALLVGQERLFAAGSDELRVGLIGCGYRGTGAVTQALMCSKSPVQLWAMGDLFRDRLDSSIEQLSSGGEKKYDRENFPPLTDKMNVPVERQFVGFDSYQKVIDSGIDIVILAGPPHFRPRHLRAAVEAGKHVFMEKPVAVDPVGVRSVLASLRIANRKRLSIVAGTQRRHQASYIEVMKRIHSGDIGNIVAAQCYFNTGFPRDWGYWHKRQPGWSDMEWQCRNWYYFTWLSGDHVVEQHIHNLDIINWAFQGHPVKAMGMGGRQVRVEPEYGNIYDHFTVEYEYPNGARVISMCRQINGCSVRVEERIVGTRGAASEGVIKGRKPFEYRGPSPNAYVQEHAELIASIREGKPINEGRQVAESTLTAIMGRMSAYTGRALSWNWAMNSSKLDLTPDKYEFGDLPVGPVSIPGKTQLV
jgi:myo-inositol 2-dehydrogenase/D-chiro-inositol 1-dehydrogenase